jgi:hypothetical protein
MLLRHPDPGPRRPRRPRQRSEHADRQAHRPPRRKERQEELIGRKIEAERLRQKMEAEKYFCLHFSVFVIRQGELHCH